MKKNIWLARDVGGWYGLYMERPNRYYTTDGKFAAWDSGKPLIKYLCGTIAKDWFGLKKHMRAGELCYVSLEIKCKKLKNRQRR